MRKLIISALPNLVFALASIAGGVGTLLLAEQLSPSSFGLLRWVVALVGVLAVAGERVSRGVLIRDAINARVDPPVRRAVAWKHAIALALAGIGGLFVLWQWGPTSTSSDVIWAGALLAALMGIHHLRFRTVWAEVDGRLGPWYAASGLSRSLPLLQVAAVAWLGTTGLAVAAFVLFLPLVSLIWPRKAAAHTQGHEEDKTAAGGPKSSLDLDLVLSRSRLLIATAAGNAIFLFADVLFIGILLDSASVAPVALSSALAMVSVTVLTAAAPRWLRRVLTGDDSGPLLRTTIGLWLIHLIGASVAFLPLQILFPNAPLRWDIHVLIVAWHGFLIYHAMVTGPFVHRAAIYRFHATAIVLLAVANVIGDIIALPLYGIIAAPLVSLAVLSLHHVITLWVSLPKGKPDFTRIATFLVPVLGAGTAVIVAL